ncbi:Heterokaryon incompatibility protein s [Daldinia childiae]|uniref:Heterokaryon incompatibility protein s n=1 Tax=Daldinia childiae TaxID=326645 RepID=UPI0014454EAC|nr:Heterokaryon incompatibility protein s [Daldinia childiae]KAF3067070.1 Heterokaryon incompatibility protein s [Daldinia childiae]
MEVAGLVVGGVSLAGLFTACVDCFEYIQLGRQFGKNYQTSVLKLDLLKLRLSRWADSVNHSDSRISVQSEEEIDKVKEVLGQIIYLFEETEKKTGKFKGLKGDTTGMPAGGYPDADIESLHQKMKSLALKRQRRTSFAQKASWALCEEKYFKRLIEDLEPLVKDLVEMFPVVKEQQRQLSIEEARELQGERGINALQEANEGEDELLRESIAQSMVCQAKHKFLENVVNDEVRVRYGDELEDKLVVIGVGSLYEKNKASGKVIVHYGDHYGQGSIFL